MRVVVIGATGNVGTALVRALDAEPEVSSMLGVARRVPGVPSAKADWASADVARDELEPLLRGADAVVHLAWRIQPSRRVDELRRTNVLGTARVLDAAVRAGVPVVVAASSVGAYSPGPKDAAVDESWPVDGIRSSFYARHKAEVERQLDRLAREHPDVRSAWLRPGLTFQRESATEQRRLFLGPLLPTALLRRGLFPVLPDVPGLRVQAVHADDVADAYRRVLLEPGARGPYNVAADPPLDARLAARVLGARTVRVPAGVVRAAAGATWRLRLQPTPAGWVDLALAVPLLDSGRARRELGWAPAHDAVAAVTETLAGMRDAAGAPTPALSPQAGGPWRVRELLTGVGGRDTA